MSSKSPISRGKPDFIIAGATRSGTSTLHYALDQSPHIFMPPQKEIHYFARDALFEQGSQFYTSHFDGAGDDQICGEASPTYFIHGHTIDKDVTHQWSPDNDSVIRMAREYPNMKVILSLRHPAVRAHSFFWRVVWQGQEKAKSLEIAIEEEIAGGRHYKDTAFCPLYLSRYKVHLGHWLKYFPRENLKILIMEEWTKVPADTVADIEDFIGASRSGIIDEDVQPTNQGRRVAHPLLKAITRIAPTSRLSRAMTRRVLSRQGYPDLKPETFARLCNIFEEDITYVESVLGRDIPEWREMVV